MNAPTHRILFVAHSPHRGGAEYCLDTTLRHLDRSRFEPLVVFPFEGPLVDSTRELGIETLVMPMCHWLYFKKDLWYWRNLVGRSWSNVNRFKRLIRDRDIDIVYTNTSAIFESALAAKKAGVPHLWHVHEVLQPGNAMSQLLPIPWLQRFIRKYSDQVIFESHSAKAAFEETTPVSNSEVVFNSVRLGNETLSVDQITQTRRTLGLADDVATIVYVGQFIDRKNPLLVIEALSRLSANIDVQCLLVGEGPLEAAMQDRIRQYELTERCSIVPFQRDITPVLAASDILVLPSRQESFGLVLVEAAAFGKPVIACRCQGPCEIIVDGETGFLIEQDDAAALATAITDLVQAPERAKRMGEAGRCRVNQMFSPDSNTRKLELLIGGLLGIRSEHDNIVPTGCV